MSGNDSIVFNTNERATSGDFNDGQSLAARTLSNLLREALGLRSFSFGARPSESPRNVVLGGLEVSPSGNDVAIAAGALLQDSAVLVPIPGSLDSPYRLGANLGTITEATPAPGSDTWYLLEAQVASVVALTTTRDIYDTGTETFVPTPGLTKRIEKQIDFQFIAGTTTNAPAPSGGDWVPIAIVFRPAGGGPVLSAHLIDVRPMWDALTRGRDSLSSILAQQGDRLVITSHRPGGAVSSSAIVDAEVFSQGCRRLWYARSGALDLSGVGVLSPATTLAASTWYYLYLCPWSALGLGPVDPRDGSATGKGVLVLSHIAPSSQGENRNSSALTLPAPYSTPTVGAGLGVLVGAFRRNSANTGFIWTESHGDRVFMREPVQVASAVPYTTPVTVALGTSIPLSAKWAIIRVLIEPNTGTNVSASVAAVPVGGGAADLYDAADMGTADFGSVIFRVPCVVSSSFDLRVDTGGTAPDLRANLIGWVE